LTQCVRWQFGDRFSHRAQLFINKEASDPQIYSPAEYRPRYKLGLSPQFKPCPRDCVQPVKYRPLTRPFDQLSLLEKSRVPPGPGAYSPPSAFDRPAGKKTASASAKTLKAFTQPPSFLDLKRSSGATGSLC
jgi:hypothetical protein